MRHCLILWGAAGTGKSTWAMQHGWPKPEEIYLKNSNNKWWDGYQMGKHKCVIIDEIMYRTEFPMEQMKHLLDVNNQGFQGEVKATPKGAWINPDKVICISNYNPMLWWKDAEQDPGWKRRATSDDQNPVRLLLCPP